MRIPLAVIALVFAAAAAAQSQPRPLPPGSKPLEEPPPPPLIQGDPAPEPQVTTRKEGDNTIQEYRLRGRLYMVRVTPAHGIAYVMIDQKGDGQFRKQDNLESGLRVPQWVLLEF